MQKLFRSLIAVGGLAGLVACGDDVSVTAPPVPDLAISGAPVTAVSVGAKVQLSANQAATWASSAANVATVDATGLVTAVAAGTASITATSTADVNKKASVTITVVAPAVRSVTVAPNAVTMNPGGTQGFVANVDADAGVARTVTWSTSNAAVVTVTAAGVATAVAPGAATITATSTANTGVAGAASVTVRTPTAARVSIQKVTVAGNLNAPVNLAAAGGQIDVTIDVDPGDFIAQKVDLLVDGVVVGSQTFTSAQSMDLTNAHAFADLAGAVASTVISFNTAAFNATTGEVLAINKNGPHLMTARLTTTGGASGSTATPSSNLAITFANANTFISNVVFTGTTASATGTNGTAAGLAYRRGGMTFTIIPVIYNVGQSIVATGSTLFFGGTCDASGTGQRNVPLTGTGPFTATFPQATPQGGSNTNTLMNYEFSPPSCAFGNVPLFGEVPVLVAVDNNGNTIMNGAGPTVATGFRIDNRAPGAPSFAANPNGRRNSWINDAVALNAANAGTGGTANNWIVNGTADAGIGGGSTATGAYQRWLRIADATGGLVDAARDAAASDAATLPAPTVTSIDKCAIVTARDQLGNESARPGAGNPCFVAPDVTFGGVGTGTTHLRFGVDIDEPTIAYAGIAPALELSNGERVNVAAMNQEFVVTVADIGVIGVSGMLAQTPINQSVIRREATGTIFTAFPDVTSDCVIGSLNNALTTCSIGTRRNTNAVLSGLNVALPLVATTMTQVTAESIDGYYTHAARAFDAAGNFTDLAAPATIVFDDTPPALTTAIFNIPLNGPQVVFNANASDNLDLWFTRYRLLYPTAALGGTATGILFPDVQINTFNAATLMFSNISAGITVNGFMRQLQNVTANGPLNAGAGQKPTALEGTAFDQGNNPSALASTGINGAQVTNGVSFLGTVPASQQVFSWAISAPAAAVNISANNTTLCGPVTPATATTVTLTADAHGPTALFNTPFSRIDFYVLVGVNLVQVGTGQQQPIFDDGSAQGRRHRWTFDFTPGATFGCAGALTVHAIGVNSLGDGLTTLPNVNITIVP